MKSIAFIVPALLSVMAFAPSANAGGAACYKAPRAQAHAMHKANRRCNAPVIKQKIHINCFRGPWRETIWDHPQGRFIDDLVKFGYGYGDALGIATDICKNERLVGDREGLKAELRRAIAEDPPRR